MAPDTTCHEISEGKPAKYEIREHHARISDRANEGNWHPKSAWSGPRGGRLLELDSSLSSKGYKF
ncbi:hypothetical protein NCCP133_37950 [Cytobacillus sp. NCCP-133]|nr:hypothetical protein NCCP133_37950 [Cytobacillus sp. NCCP-133]